MTDSGSFEPLINSLHFLINDKAILCKIVEHGRHHSFPTDNSREESWRSGKNVKRVLPLSDYSCILRRFLPLSDYSCILRRFLPLSDYYMLFSYQTGYIM